MAAIGSPTSATRPAQLDRLKEAIAPARAALAAHPLYDALDGLEAIRRFMSLHVWAVYDFMVLLGAVRERFAPATRDWVPPIARAATRGVNEITLAEESDVTEDGQAASHFDLYLVAMHEVGADTDPILTFIERVRSGYTPKAALLHVDVPIEARDFSLTTHALAERLPAAAAALCYGREQLLPDLFVRMLDHAADAPVWRYYLERHVELDGDVHGDDAEAILTAACNTPEDWAIATDGAFIALAARTALWDAALCAIQA